MLRSAVTTVAGFALVTLLSFPLAAETAPAAPVASSPAPAAAAATEAAKAVAAPEGNASVDDKRMGQMRERWRKMSPEQRDEMRKKSERRLQERYDRLKPDQQNKINGIIADLDKLSKEEKSILMAKVRQKAYKERQQRKMLKELENQGKSEPGKPAAAPVAPAH